MATASSVLSWVALAAACLALATLPPPAAAAAAAAQRGVAIAAPPVRVDFYMEALCPFCANFTASQLAPLFANKLINYVQLDVIPYGNARLDTTTGKVACQHGPTECALNQVLSCALALNPIQDDFFRFLLCVEEAVLEERRVAGISSTSSSSLGAHQQQQQQQQQRGGRGIDVDALTHKCAVRAGLVPQRITDCAQDELGASLQRLAAERTASLRPPHKWVPWVTVNGIPLLDDDENLARYICVAYAGRDRPRVCLDAPGPELTPTAAAAAPGDEERGGEEGSSNTARFTRCQAGEEGSGGQKQKQEHDGSKKASRAVAAS